MGIKFFDKESTRLTSPPCFVSLILNLSHPGACLI